MKRIVVGTDGSETAAIAVGKAVDLAAALGAELELVSAYPEPPPGYRRPHTTRRSPRTRRRARCRRTSRARSGRVRSRSPCWRRRRPRRRAAGVEGVRTHPREGDPATALLTVAEETGADLIVVGNRGMTGAARFLLGSVPNKLSHHANCSILIVRTT